MTEFGFLGGEAWGITWVRAPQPERMPDPEVAVHHTGGGVTLSGSDGREMAINFMQGLNRYAQSGKGYSALDYDDVVIDLFLFGGPDEVWICEGRGRFMSAATLDRNEESEAICVAGMFHPGFTYAHQPRQATIEGVARGIVRQINEGRVVRNPTIYGHRDNPANPQATVCPGAFLSARIPEIRDLVEQFSNPTPKPNPEPETDPDLSEDFMHEYITLEPLSKGATPLFERVGNVCYWVDSDRWAALGHPSPRHVSGKEAKQLVLVGGIDGGNNKWRWVRNRFGQVVG